MNIGIDHGYYAIKTRRLAAFRAASQQSWHAHPRARLCVCVCVCVCVV